MASKATRPTRTKSKAKSGPKSRAKPKPRPDADLLGRLREICLGLPEATEVEAWGHPTFRVNNKIFAGFGGDQDSASLGVKTTMEMQSALVSSDPRFSIAAYVGKHGWVDFDLTGRFDWAEVEALVRGSYQLVAPAKLAARL